MEIMIKSRWWVVKIDRELFCLSYRNPNKLETYLKKIFTDVDVVREATLKDYNSINLQERT